MDLVNKMNQNGKIYMMNCKGLLRFARNRQVYMFCTLNLRTLLVDASALFALTLLLLYALPIDAAEVKNIKPSQAGNRVLFEFDVAGEPKEEADVSITLTINGKTHTSDKLHLEGDFGKVKAGKGKKIYWNVLQDFPRGFNQEFDFEIVAGGKAFKDPATGIEMVYVKGGCYQMGDTFGVGEDNENPVHEVCVDDFYIGKYEVTQGQWKAIMGKNPSYFKDCGDNCPVEGASWNDIQDFINKLNQKTGKNYKLPTEAEWEYAARSGGKSEKYSGGNNIDSVAWYDKNSGNKIHPVGTKQPNGLGIYDMTGNVWEWVNDWHHSDYYKNSPKNNPTGPNSGTGRVRRGGSWGGVTGRARSASRDNDSPGSRLNFPGFRLARTQ